MLWEHTRTKPSSFKRTHSSQFQKSLSSSLRLVFLYFWHIILSRAPQTRIDSSQAPFQLFPVRTHHIHWSSFKGTHSRQFQSWPLSELRLVDTDFSTHGTICDLNSQDLLHALFHVLHIPNPAPSGYLLLISTQIGSNQVSFLTQQSQPSVWIETITHHVLYV